MAVDTTTIVFKDAKGQTASTQFYTPSSVSAALLEAFVEVLIYDIHHMTMCGVVSVTTTKHYQPDVPEMGVIEGNSDVEEGAQFIFRSESGNPTKMRIPGFWEGQFLPGTKLVDLADEFIDEFVSFMIEGYTDVELGTITPCDSRGEDLISLILAKEKFLPRKGA